jgi:DNA-binding transcriptional MocR family regulator
MRFNVHKKSSTPIYQQIYEQIRYRIQTSMIKPGDQLPSLRKLSQELEISLLTVRKAYQLLQKSGLIVIQSGKGAFVKGVTKRSSKVLNNFSWQDELNVNITRSQYSLNRDRKYYDFSQAILFPRLLPNQFLAQEMQSLLRTNELVLATYGPIQGDRELRMELSSYLQREQGIKAEPHEIMITSGAQQGIDLIAQTLLKPGDTVIVESPCYGAAIDVFTNKGVNVISIELDEEGIQSDLVEEVCQKIKPSLLYVNPSFQNPTGILMSRQRRKELVDLAELYHFFIVEDDSFGEIYFDDISVPPPIKTFDKNGHVLFLKGFSKTLAPGLRIGLLYAQGSVFDWLYAVKALMDIGSPLLTQKAVLAFLRTERMKQHMEKLRIALQLRRDHASDLLSPLSDYVQFQVPKGGFNLWLKLPQNVNTFALLKKAQEHNVCFLPGEACFVHKPPHAYIRISYSLLSDTDLNIGLQRLNAIFSAEI